MNKFLYALRSIGITIVGVVIAVLVTSGLHLLFALFLDDLPVGVLWTTIDVVVTVALTALAFVIAGGLRKHEGTERVSTEDGVCRG